MLLALQLQFPSCFCPSLHRSSSGSSRRDKKKARNSWRMAILNHAKDNRLGVWRPKQYETNGLRGRILVFRFLEPQSATPSPSRVSSAPSATRSPPTSALFFSVIFPTAHLSLLNETREADGAGALLFFGRSSPLSFSSFFCHRGTGCKKERALREPAWRQALQWHLQGP